MSFRTFVSRNPNNNKVLQSFKFLTQQEVSAKIQNSFETFKRFRFQPQQDKIKKLIKLSDLIEANVDKYARIITTEMGKPIGQSTAEVKKSAAFCRYYAENAEKFLKPQRVKTEAQESYVKYEPLGPVYVIAPFNFPFFLAFKPVLPQILLGNTILLRPSDSTPLCGLAVEELFIEAGFDENHFQNVFTSPESLDDILGDSRVQGVSFTGSTRAGRIIAQCAGKHLKRSVMELGGMDPFMVMKDANIKKAVELAIRSRITNCGQVCFSAKRFIVHEELYESFKTSLIEQLSKVKLGDPLSINTDMGPMARIDLLTNLQSQIDDALQLGGIKLLIGGQALSNAEEDGNFYPPTVLECSTPETMNSLDEIFGPVFTMISASSDEEIIKIANDSKYGLGAVVVSESKDIKSIVSQLESGMVFVNEVVKSDARLPSGGIKNSGYGRECGEWGVQNFANIKTVWIQ